MKEVLQLPDWYTNGGQIDSQALGEYCKQLYEPRFSVSQIGVSRQELLYWKQKGILDTQPPNADKSKAWVRVNVFDFCWIQVVVALRKMHVPLETIAALKLELVAQTDKIFTAEFMNGIINEAKRQAQTLNQHVVSHFEKEVTNRLAETVSQLKGFLSVFNLITLHVISSNKPVALLVQPDGSFFILDISQGPEPSMINEYMDFIQQPFVSIPLLPIMSVFVENTAIKKADLKWLFNLTETELQLLELLKEAGVKEIRIRLNQHRKGEIFIETIRHLNPESFQNKILGIINKEAFQDIKISIEDGRLKFVEETTKTKIKL